MELVSGSIVRDDQVFSDYHDPRSFVSPSLTLWPERRWTDDRLVCFEADRILVTSHFVPIDMGRGRLILNQSYSQIEHMQPPPRFRIDGDRFALESRPIPLPGRHVVLGGPIDGVWYHWLFNWCPRLILLKMMRPELFDDPSVRFAVHPRALEQPFRAILDTFGIDPARFTALDPEQDYLLERGVIVSFLDQAKLYPRIMRRMADHVLAGLRILHRPMPATMRGIFASRQPLPPPKRRIANFGEVEPVLRDEFGLRTMELGTMSARDQAYWFRNANIVVGAHGSDLTNLLFCRPGTSVLVIENAFSIRYDLHVGLQFMCELLGLDYEYMLVPTERRQDAIANTTAGQINEDYLVDPEALRDRLRAILDRRRARRPRRLTAWTA